MKLEFADWRFQVDAEATRRHTTKNASDHCECAYCRNYYDTLASTYPDLCVVLAHFGIDPMGPSELMPFTPTLFLACYRVDGKILRWGKSELNVDGIPIVAEAAEDDTFLLWVGELELPWVQEEAAEEVMSPANLPEFLERMQQVWQLRHGQEFVCS
ncbi:MAG: hypothetical protein ACI3WQ_06955 [Faecousia sp.]